MMLLIWLKLLATVYLYSDITHCANIDFPSTVCEIHQKDGDYIIGGIFKPYYPKTCSGEITNEAVCFIEAMTYAVESINNQSDLLANIQLGFEVRNACEDEDITLWTLMTMATSVGRYEFRETCPNQERTNSGKVIGIVGTGRSATSIIAAKFGRVLTTPVVSYFATSDELSDSGRFPFFFRTVPPDKFQVKVIADILRHFNWKYIALFYSLDSYGIHGARQIVRLAEKYDICIAINVPVAIPAPGIPASQREVKDIAKRLSDHDKVSVIVSFAVWRGTLPILQAVRSLGTSRNYTFLASDGWSPRHFGIREFQDVLIGGIFVHFRGELPDTYPEYFSKLPYNDQDTSQWYKDRLRQIKHKENCTDWNKCPVVLHWNTQQVISAVYAIAYALNATLQETALFNESTSGDIDGWALRRKMLEVSIPSTGNNYFQFDENGEVPGTYQINNWQMKNGQYDLVNVGKWNSLQEKYLYINEDKIQWGAMNQETPISLCIEECNPGYIEIPLEKKCCWVCQKCNDYAIVVKGNNDTAMCKDCAETEWPNDDFTTCVAIEPLLINYHYLVFIVSTIGAGFGLILTLFAAIGLCYYSEHRLIKASSRELCSINLVGLGLFCVAVILNLLEPTDATCVSIEIMTSTSFCVSYAPVLLKVNRIWRIFSMTPGTEVRLKSPKSQVGMAGCIIFIQVLVAIASILFTPAVPALLIPPQRRPYLGIYCRFGYGFIAACGYNAMVIIACCYYALRARRVPDNFNESKFIGVSVYSTLIVCLAAIPVYATAINVRQKIAALNILLLVNTYLSLCCLYLPKIYAIRYQKENVNSTTGSSPSISASAQKCGHVPTAAVSTASIKEAPKTEVLTEDDSSL